MPALKILTENCVRHAYVFELSGISYFLLFPVKICVSPMTAPMPTSSVMKQSCFLISLKSTRQLPKRRLALLWLAVAWSVGFNLYCDIRKVLWYETWHKLKADFYTHLGKVPFLKKISREGV